MFDKVLIPLDGSQQAESILPFVSQLAKGLDVPVVVASALALDGGGSANLMPTTPAGPVPRAGAVPPSTTGGSPAPSERFHERKNSAQNYLNGVAERLSAEGVTVEIALSQGNPAEELIQIAERAGCHLIMLATHTKDQAKPGVLGSVTVKVLHASHIPVMLIDPQRADVFAGAGFEGGRIIVPLDGSAFGESALPYAEDLACKLGLPIHLVRAVGQVNPAYLGDPSTGVLFTEDMEEAVDEEANHYLNQILEKLTSEGMTSQVELLHGAPAKCIVACASEQPNNLVVMTTHGHSALARWLLGSVTEAVVRSCEGAILVIPRQYGKQYALEVTAMLEQTPIFSRLSEEDLQSIAQAARLRFFKAGEVIVKEGDSTGGFFVITMGRVEVLKEDGSADAKAIDEMGVGEFFGEMSIVDDSPRSATIRAVEPTECVTIRRSDFMRQLEQRPEIAVHMLPGLVQRLREARDNPMA